MNLLKYVYFCYLSIVFQQAIDKVPHLLVICLIDPRNGDVLTMCCSFLIYQLIYLNFASFLKSELES